ncbi:DNA-3-methyladenine glycosylase family protein [Aestuariirhabdus sp. LZHN29]|uniref:DNA-3-methyladenine glycosylase family protein n=1 Tax=Aestuariirhabdus sp. LZHN29 TaxID=3417462 RepID=UPI003CF6E980
MNKSQLAAAMSSLATIDMDVANALGLIGPPPPRIRPAGFETFLSTIVSQQISTSAARAILARVTALMPNTSALALLEVEDDALRGAGLSYRKIEYAKGLAEAVARGTLDIDGLASLSDEKAIQTITSLRGFGRWSAEIYLMFSLKRPDIFPADDLALLVALGRLKQLPGKPTPKQARDLTAHWAPWRSAGSLFLWHYYRGAPT